MALTGGGVDRPGSRVARVALVDLGQRTLTKRVRNSPCACAKSVHDQRVKRGLAGLRDDLAGWSFGRFA